MRGEGARPFHQFLLFAFQNIVRHTARAIAMHQFVQCAPRFTFQKRLWQIKSGMFMEKLDDLRFLRPFDLVFFFVLEIVFDHVTKIGNCFSGRKPGRKRIVDRWKDLLFDFV